MVARLILQELMSPRNSRTVQYANDGECDYDDIPDKSCDMCTDAADCFAADIAEWMKVYFEGP